MLVMLGAAVVIVGFCPRFTVLLWAYVAYSVFAVYFGVLINLPQWAVKLSPFGWNPQLPVEPFEVQTACFCWDWRYSSVPPALGVMSGGIWIFDLRMVIKKRAACSKQLFFGALD